MVVWPVTITDTPSCQNTDWITSFSDPCFHLYFLKFLFLRPCLLYFCFFLALQFWPYFPCVIDSCMSPFAYIFLPAIQDYPLISSLSPIDLFLLIEDLCRIFVLVFRFSSCISAAWKPCAVAQRILKCNLLLMQKYKVHCYLTVLYFS